MATEKGIISTGVLYTDRLDFYPDMDELMVDYRTHVPLLGWANAQQKITNLKGPQFKMFQYTPPWVEQYFKVTTGATSADDDAEDTLAVTVTGSKGMGTALSNALVGLQCEVHSPNDAGTGPAGIDDANSPEAKGVVVITTFTSTTSINVKNTGSSSFTIADNDWLVVTGNVFGEGTTAANPKHDELEVVWGQCGILKTSYQITGTLKEAVLRGETKEFERLRKVAMATHMVQKERFLMFSSNKMGTNLSASDTFAEGNLTDVDGNIMRPTYGIMRAMLDYGNTTVTDKEQSVFDIPRASYQYDDWVDDSEKFAEYDYQEGGIKKMFVSSKLRAHWAKLNGPQGAGLKGASNWRVEFGGQGTNKLGLKYKIIVTPSIDLEMINLPSLTQSSYNGYGFIPNAQNIHHAIYRNFKLAQNVKTEDDFDGQKDSMMSDEGLGLGKINTHKLLRLR